MHAEHAEAVLGIYASGIATGTATFQSEPPTWDEFDAGHLPEHRFVALDGDTVLGWVAVSPVSGRCVYAGVVEHSVYVAPEARGRGVGRALLDHLLESAGAAGIWTVQSGVFPQNVASLALHEAAGFRVVGTRERLGLMGHGPHADTWLDVVLLEKRL
ncbi:GNAT family N-acetyltransferase [Cellulomonas hominis]|jgi:phosphinothricin acetyltransferase|uniref:GNAT family N-acetyltransferase n=1 Tax=Cellulomonas hominis TaxID=156981 RepID=UPI0019BF1EC2|nr:GNAT family N-acetyltransferase [Cellulomonas hominis]MBD3777730.1 N-acetyltransferase family protein [Micrococcales bacterium]MBU5421159.1 GNAT family N-acetyltransferase [Cellulomonas hominis]